MPTETPVQIPIFESEYVSPGQALLSTDPATLGSTTLVLHPLDAIALRYKNPYERLDAAMAWIVARAHRRLDELEERIRKS